MRSANAFRTVAPGRTSTAGSIALRVGVAWLLLCGEGIFFNRGLLVAAASPAAAASAALAAAPTPAPPSAAPSAPPSPANASAAAGSDPQLERGRYLVAAGNCVSCHTRPGGEAFAGGLLFTTPFGLIYSSNITPDPATGIGQWTAADLRQAMHEGIGRGGYRLFPAFPYTSFTRVSDQDVDAIYAYLRSIRAVRYTPPSNGILFRMRGGMAVWDWLFFKPGRFQADPRQSVEWNRGAYLVNGLGHCDACHTPRNILMAEIDSEAFAGGSFSDRVTDGTIRRWSAVNLTAAHSGLAPWTVDILARYLQKGFSPRAGTFGPMNDVIVNSLRNLTSQDVHAMATYLKSLPARELSTAGVPANLVQAGGAVYKDRCEECHQSSGRGSFFNSPPLAGSAVVQDSDPASLINAILYGPTQAQQVSYDGWETMKPYKDVLSDAEVAAVCNYIRGSWGNRAPPVTAAEVARQR